MGYYAYCRKCGEGVGKPTLREMIHDNQHCCHCGNKRDIDEDEKKWALDGVLDRIEAIEAKLGIKSDV